MSSQTAFKGGVLVSVPPPPGSSRRAADGNFRRLGRLAVELAAGDPGPFDDAAHDFAAGSIWYNTAASTGWICTDASVGAAQWAEIAGGIVAGEAVTWAQPIQSTTSAAGDRAAAFGAAAGVSNVSEAGAYSGDGKYYVLLSHNAAPSSIDYRVTCPNATALEVAADYVNGLDATTRTISIQYSTDGGTSFTTLASAAPGASSPAPTTLTGTIDLGQTTARAEGLVVRLGVAGAAGGFDLVGWSRVRLAATGGGPIRFVAGQQPRVTIGEAGVAIDTTINRSPGAPFEANGAAAQGTAGVIGVFRITRPVNVGVVGSQIAEFQVGAYAATSAGEPNTRVDLALSTSDTGYTVSAVPMSWRSDGRTDFGGPARLKGYAVSALPAAGVAGRVAFPTDGRKVGEGPGAGTGVLAYDDGTAWRRSSDDTTVAA